jgi:copper transport protein
MRFTLRMIWVCFAVAALFSQVSPAAAHGYILRAIPEDRAVLERPPARLQYWFSEGLEPNFSRVILRDQTGAVLAEGEVDAGNSALMTLRVPQGLPDGAYVVELRPAFASDGHVVAQSRVFFVGEAVAGVTGAAADYHVPLLEVAWRVVVLAATLLLLGAFVLYGWVLVPAWGSPQYPAGGLPPRVMRRLTIIVIGALAAALVGNVVALVQQSMVFFNTDSATVLAQGLWGVVRIGSRFGDVWNVRMLLLALVGVTTGLSIYYRARFPQFVGAFWKANAWALALVLGTFSLTAHAAGALLWPWAAVMVDWLHVLAVAVWVGGLAALVLVLPVALQPYSGEARRLALLAALRRFSRLALASLVVVIATGIYSALTWLYTPADVTGTAWGGALLVKSGLVVGLVLLGAAHHVAANSERYARWAALLGRPGSLALTLRLEVALALAVLVVVAMLAATPVPAPDFLEESTPAPHAITQMGDLTVSMTISPGGPGVNTYDLVMLRDDAPVEDAQARLQFVNPARDQRSPWQMMEAVDAGLYVTAGAEIDTAGRWLAVYDLLLPDDEAERVVFEWDIRSEAAVIQTREPTLVHAGALALVIGAVLFALYPLLVRLYHWLDWRPASLAVAASALAGLALFVGLAVVIARQSEADYRAAINPTPQVVNDVLPDAESLRQGALLFERYCDGWAGRDLALLVERVWRLRDEDLYTAVVNGWQGLSACSLTNAEQRWHIVNYLRALG